MTLAGFALNMGGNSAPTSLRSPGLRIAPATSQPAPALARILVSDDNPGIQQIYGLLLPRHGFEVVTVPGGNGYTTVSLCRELLPHLLITDVNKPGLNGHQVVQALRADPATAHIPVIFVTAMDEWLERRRGQRVDADDHLVKPFVLESLIYKIVTLLALSRDLQERLANLTLDLMDFEQHHPVTGIAGPQALGRALPLLNTRTSWAALTFAIAGFEHLVRSGRRTLADDLLLRLALAIRGALGPFEREVVLGHPGYDARITLIGPASLLNRLAQQVQERFSAEVQRRIGTLAGATLPTLTLTTVDASAGPIGSLAQLMSE